MEMDSKMFWKYITRKKFRPDNYHVIEVGTDKYISPDDQANMWKKHFHKLLNEPPCETSLYDDEWKVYIDNQVERISANSRTDSGPDGINMDPFTCVEITKIVATLPNGKAPGVDLVSYEHIKHGGDMLILCITTLFNAILKLNQVPDAFKQGLLIPLYKGGRKARNNVNSYRGITLLPSISKILERCIYDRMTVKLEAINFPSRLQFAGKKGSNCLMASFCLQEMILTITKRRSKVFSAFLDMEKCFDKIWWNGMLYKLHNIGITDSLWLLIRNWYVGSKCVVLSNGIYSDTFSISRGIRQGGVLSMVMMTVAFCDIHSSIDPECDHGLAHGNTYLGTPTYADDLVVLSYTATDSKPCLITHIHTLVCGDLHSRQEKASAQYLERHRWRIPGILPIEHSS
jgi:hypothetical protein